MENCKRPSCEKPLKTGKFYCSTGCSAKDKKRIKAVKKMPIPEVLSMELSNMLGEDTAIVFEQVRQVLLQEAVHVPIPTDGQTYGDWSLSFDGKREFRPGDNLDFEIIERMLKSGPVIFAMEMKRAQVMRVFSEGRYKVQSPDKELAKIAEASLRGIMSKMADDFTFSAFATGVSFQEEIWERKTKYELGLSNSKGSLTKFAVPKVPHAVDPKTVEHIDRDGSKFDGFTQRRKATEESIKVDRDQALVIPLNERYRNLWGTSFLLTIYPIWLWYEIIIRAMARYMERMSTPVALAKAPSRGLVEIEGKSAPVKAMDMALSLAGNISKSNAVAIPSDRDESGNPLWELTYLTAQERAQPFIDVLEFLGQEMVKAALSADRSTTQPSGGSGSRSIGEVHAKASSLTSEMILLQFLYYLNNFFMPGFSLYNRGVNGPPIWLKTQAIDLSEREALMKLINVAGNSPASQELFWMIDWRTLADTNNIPILSQADVDAMKAKLEEESLEKQGSQMELMQKFEKNADGNPQPGGIPPRSSFRPDGEGKGFKPGGQAPKSKNGATKAEQQAAIDSLFENGPVAWMLGETEFEVLLDAGMIDEEAIKLFNPFHNPSTGRFASKSGGGRGGGGGGASVGGGGGSGDLRAQTVSKASGNKGSLLKTTGKVLGLTALGLVGFAVLAGAGGGDGEGFVEVGEPGQDEEKAKEIQDRINELTSDWPKTGSVEGGANVAENALRGLGINEIPDDLSVEIGNTRSGFGGHYDFDTNTLVLRPDVAELIANGDPNAMHMLTHEMSHAAQEFDPEGQGNPFGPNDLMNPDDPNYQSNFSSYLEGQNDLVTAMAMSDLYGRPMSNDTSVGLSNQLLGLNRDLRSQETGTTITSGLNETAKTGYQSQAEIWAGIARVGSDATGQTPKDFLVSAHSTGFSGQSQAEILFEVFPAQMAAGGFVDSSLPFGFGNQVFTFPPQGVINNWLSDAGINSQQEYSNLLEEASQ